MHREITVRSHKKRSQQTSMGTAKFVVFIAVAISLTGCETWSDFQHRRDLAERRATALEEIDVAACEEAGGTVTSVCMFGMPQCVTPFADAGKTCSDSSECQGRCLFDDQGLGNRPGPVVGESALGNCEADSNPCGCWWEIADGKVQQGICAD